MDKLNTLDEGVGIALDAIRTNKVRSVLTIVGVAIGVAVVVTIAALITGIRSEILEGFEAAGPDNFIVTPFDFSEVRFVNDGSGRPPWWDKPEITVEEWEMISRLPGVAEAVIDLDFPATMEYDGRRVSSVQSSGDTEGWNQYTLGEFIAGRNFTQAEVRHSRAVVVISAALAEELFGELDPIGREVRTSAGTGSSERFEVVGVFDLEGNIFSQAVRHFAVFPYSAAAKRLKAKTRMNFYSILVIPAQSFTQAEVMDQVIGAMRARRGLGPKEQNNFAVLRSDQLIELFNDLTGAFFIIMLALSSVGLLVGGIGVIGIMMISVTERTREIGIRKSVGATRQEILWQFLVEAGVLTLMGGALGMFLGAGAAYLVANATPIPARIPLWSVAAALGMAVVTGMLFGLFPAYRASRLDPVAALRYE